MWPAAGRSGVWGEESEKNGRKKKDSERSFLMD